MLWDGVSNLAASFGAVPEGWPVHLWTAIVWFDAEGRLDGRAWVPVRDRRREELDLAANSPGRRRRTGGRVIVVNDG